jgi:hypothetical protein
MNITRKPLFVSVLALALFAVGLCGCGGDPEILDSMIAEHSKDFSHIVYPNKGDGSLSLIKRRRNHEYSS